MPGVLNGDNIDAVFPPVGADSRALAKLSSSPRQKLFYFPPRPTSAVTFGVAGLATYGLLQ